MASFSVVSNVASANAQANLIQTNLGLRSALTRLSSGYRINNSGDDAAGLAVANAYRNKIATLNQGIRNANDGLSTLQIKDGALNNISNLLDRLSTLATQAASHSSSVDRTKLNDEFTSVLSEIDREATVAGLDQSTAFSVFVSTEANMADGAIGGTIAQIDTGSSGLNIAGLSIDTDVNAQAAVAAVSLAVTTLGTAQGNVGALENRLQYAVTLAQSQQVNTQAAESRIRDANVAEESANMTRYNILTQSGVAALSQANQSASAILSLLK